MEDEILIECVCKHTIYLSYNKKSMFCVNIAEDNAWEETVAKTVENSGMFNLFSVII